MSSLLSTLVVSALFFFLSLFIYFEEAGERKREERDRDKERIERIPSRLCTVSTEPDVGLEPMNHEIMT